MAKSNKNTRSKAAPTAEELVKRVMSDYKLARDYVESNYWTTWEKNWKIYNSIRVKVGYNGISDVTDPMVYSTVSASIANIASGKPKWDYVPTREDQQGNTRVLNAYVDYVWECNNLSYKTIPWLKDMHVYGTSVFYVSLEGDKPHVVNHPIRDTFFDPTAPYLDESVCRFAIRRYLTSREQLEEMEIIDEEGNAQPMFTNLETIPNYDSDDLTDKEVKDIFLGSTLGDAAAKEQVEVLEYWTTKEVIVLANRKAVIRNDANPLMDEDGDGGMLPFVIQRYEPDSSLLYGRSMVEILSDQQELLNDLTNQDVDNATYALNNMWQIDPAYADMKDEIESIPGAVYPIPAGALAPIQKPVVTSDGLAQRQAIKESMREAVAVDQITKGLGDPNANTATEINQQQAAAGRNFGLRLQMVENEGFKRMGILFFRYIQKFVTKPIMVRVVGADGVNWEKFDPKDYEGEYEPKVQLDASVQAQQALNTQKYQGVYESLADNPMVNQTELTSLLLERAFDLDTDEVQRLLGMDGENPQQQEPAQPMPAPGAPGMPMDAQTAAAVPGATATDSGQVHESADLVKMWQVAVAEGDTELADQIITAMGFTPSQSPGNTANIDATNKKLDMAMKIQNHEREMEQPQEPTNGQNSPA